MAFKVADGFDHYNQAADFLSRSGFLQWQFPGSFLPTASFVTGRYNAGQALELSNQILETPLRAVWGARNAEQYIGFAVFLPGSSSLVPGQFVLELRDTIGNAPQLSIYFNANNYAVQVYRGASPVVSHTGITSTLLTLSSNNVWAGDCWNFIEIHPVIAGGSSGSIDVRVNGVSVFGGPVTGLNTQYTSNSWTDAADWWFGGISATSFAMLDDLYYCDTASDPGGSPNNTFLGDMATRTLFADGDGTPLQWTPDSGSSNWSRVAETAMDSDTSYISTATPGNVSQINHQPLVNLTAVIVAVQVTIAARKDDAGARVIKTGLNSGGTVSYGSDHSVPATYVYFTDPWVLDPNTSMNWTRTAVNALSSIVDLVS